MIFTIVAGVALAVNILIGGPLVGAGALLGWDLLRGNDPRARYTWTLKPIEWAGRFLRHEIITPDREGASMSRADSNTINEMAEHGEHIVGYGANVNPHFAGTARFANAQYFQQTGLAPMTIGNPVECKPLTLARIFNESALSLGAISAPATRANSLGAAMTGAYHNIGEGGFHRETHTAGNAVAPCRIIFQIGTDKNSVRVEKQRAEDPDLLDDGKLRQLVADNPEIVAIEIKLMQGAIPGEGGHLAASKMTPFIASIRGRKPGEDCNAADRQFEITDDDSLARFIDRVRKVSGLPTGIKTSYSRREHIESQFATFVRLGIYPDFITLDSGDGGTGKGPSELVNHVGALLTASLPLLVDVRERFGLKDRIRIIASGRLFTPFKGALAVAMGADFISSARGIMRAGGCVGQQECDKGTCEAGYATQNPALTARYNVERESVKVGNYIKAYEKAMIKIAHACGKADVRDLRSSDVDIMLNNGITTKPMSDFYEDLGLTKTKRPIAAPRAG
jgi:glutamate synthase domain-containing protein 2